MKLHILSARATTLSAAILAWACTAGGACAAEAKSDEISFVERRTKEENVEGPDVERTYFLVGGRRMAYGTPKDCRLTPDGNGLLILLNDTGLNGEIRLRRSPFSPELDLAANALKYRDAASKSLPGRVTEVEVQQPMLNAYPYNGWKSLGFTWTYALAGRKTVRSVSYITLEVGVQLEVTTLAAEKDAQRVGEITREFLSSWWVMPK